MLFRSAQGRSRAGERNGGHCLFRLFDPAWSHPRSRLPTGQQHSPQHPTLLAILARMAKPSVSELFEELATEFKLEPKLAEWLTAESGLAAKSLEDFAYAASSEDDVTRMVTAAKPDNPWLATSRLRQAWKSVKRSCDDEHVIRRSGMDTTDLDELLPAPELEDIESRHWARYKMTWPPEIAPADSLVSRAVRELGKRALSVMDVDKVRTQAHQQRAVRKRTKLADGVEMLSAEAEEVGCCSTLHAYMANLLTLVIAYSIRQAASSARMRPRRSRRPATRPRWWNAPWTSSCGTSTASRTARLACRTTQLSRG